MAGTFYSSYLGGGLRASTLYPVGFRERDQRVARTRRAAARPLEPSLLAQLRADNEPATPAVRQQLEALAQPGTAVVVTGQQVGLFLGPLYTLFKAATAIKLARQLSDEAGLPVVPIFWLQNEDQDFDEIASCSVPRADGELVRLELERDPELERVSLAARRLGEDLEPQLDRLAEALGDLPQAQATLALLREHYRPGVAPARAFAGVLKAIFAAHGLLVLDPRTPVVAALARPLIARALAEQPQIDALLQARAAALAQAGFDEQVRTRAGSPLAFYHPAGATGPRQRLMRAAEGEAEGEAESKEVGFVVDGSGERLSLDALLATLEREPLRFSTSALLRPLVQDSILPTAAYVGGPAEVNYFTQLAPLYAHVGLEPPLLAPRARFRLIPPAVRALLDKLKLAPAEVEGEREPLLARLAAPADDAHLPSHAWLAELHARLDAFAASDQFVPALSRPLARTRAAIERNFGRLVRAHQHQLATRDQTLAARVDRLRRWLCPAGAPQERVHAMPYYAALLGATALADNLVQAVDPLQPQTRDLDL